MTTKNIVKRVAFRLHSQAGPTDIVAFDETNKLICILEVIDFRFTFDLIEFIKNEQQKIFLQHSDYILEKDDIFENDIEELRYEHGEMNDVKNCLKHFYKMNVDYFCFLDKNQFITIARHPKFLPERTRNEYYDILSYGNEFGYKCVGSFDPYGNEIME